MRSPIYLECVRLLSEAYVEWSHAAEAGHYDLIVDAWMMAVVLQLRQWHLRKH